MTRTTDAAAVALERVRSTFDRDELVELCIAIGSVESPYGGEGDAGQFVYDWLDDAGFRPRKVGLIEERFNVVGVLEGGDGPSLALNSHLDTGRSRQDTWTLRDPDAAWYHSAWVQDGVIVGDGVINDKGPMAAFLLAARAIRDAGIELDGDLMLTAVCGEIGQEPVDEFQGLRYQSKDVGARYMATHGAVIPDRVLVAEATSFKLVGLEAGKLHVKVTAYGHEIYTPYLAEDRYEKNAITRIGEVIERIRAWTPGYEASAVLETPVGVCRPKVNIGAIRGGAPYRMTHTSEVCSVYVDIRLAPGASPAAVLRDFKGAFADLDAVAVEPYLYRAGHVVGDDPELLDGARWAHEQVRGGELEIGDGPVASMWRDINVFNEIGIPAITYGPPRAAVDGMAGVRVEDICDVALFYAAAALRLCGVKG
jgi:acetylornithine deacetylase/succinyl-diaminopimelate desuccinylase-like protein